MKKRIKKIVCLILSTVMFTLVPTAGYVEAAFVPAAALTAFEVVSTILLSLGVTVQVSDALATDDEAEALAKDLANAYDTYAEEHGIENATPFADCLNEWVSTDSRDIVITGDMWQGLRSWSQDIANGVNIVNNISDVWEWINSQYAISESFAYEGINTESYDLIKDYMSIHFDCNNSSMCSWAVRYLSGYGYPGFISVYETSSSVCADYYRTSGNVSNIEYITFSDGSTGYKLSSTSANMKHYTKSSSSTSSKSYSASYFGFSLGRKLAYWNGERIYFLEPLAASPISSVAGVSTTVAGGSAVKDGTWDIVTPGRTWDGETLTGDVAISVPTDVAAEVEAVVSGEKTVTQALESAIAVPVDVANDVAIDSAGTITETIDYVDAQEEEYNAVIEVPAIDEFVGSESAGEYYVQGLETVFPFCLPFDVIAFLEVLSAPAEAPYFEVPFKYPTLDGMETYVIEIDLSAFDSVARIFRTCQILLFCVGLASATRSLYIRG